IEAGLVVDRHHPFGRLLARSVAAIRQRDPEPVVAAMAPYAPAVVLLDRIGELEPGIAQRREPGQQPPRKIFAEAARIDEVRPDLPVLEQVGGERDVVLHARPGPTAPAPAARRGAPSARARGTTCRAGSG